MDIRELVDLVAQREVPFPEIQEAPRGARFGDLPSETFVPAELELDLPWEYASTPNVVLIHAPAAVGKSVLARHLARSTYNPYWDLSAFRMGSAFFSGTVARTYGVPAVESFTHELAAGELTLILDAVDEAAVGSTSTSYFAALDDLAAMINGMSAGVSQAVLLGREETILATAGRLEEAGIRVGVLSVKYFSEPRAREFVRVLAGKDSPSGRLLPDFDSFLDEFFSRVTRAFATSKWQELKSFLGYAPVLDSVATFYREAENAYATLQDFRAPESHLAVWELLSDLIRVILEREQSKFANNFGGESTHKRRFGASAYTPEHQCRLLLSSEPDQVPTNPELTDDVEPDWLNDIQLGVNDWFHNHPFVPAFAPQTRPNPLKIMANAAFRDFTVAFSAELDDASVVEETASFLGAHDVNASVMLSKFVQVEARRGALSVLPSRLVGAVVDSHAVGDPDEGQLILSEQVRPDGGDDDDAIEMSLQFHRRDTRYGVVELPVIIEGEVILGREVRNLLVYAPSHEVSIGSFSPEAQLGPSVSIRCLHFASQSPEVRVFGRDDRASDGDDRRVKIRANSVGGMTRLVHGVPASLEMIVPPVAYPWERFRIEVDDKQAAFADDDLVYLGLEFRTIAQWFTRGKGKFEATKMDTIIAKGRASRKMFDYCVHDDVVWRDKTDYRFRSPFMNTVVQGIVLTDSEYRAWLVGAWRWLNS